MVYPLKAMKESPEKTLHPKSLQTIQIKPLRDIHDEETLLNSITELEQCFPSPWSRTQIEGELSHPCALVYGAFQEEDGQANQLVGWSCLHFLAPEAELFKIAVWPQWQRKGIATALMDHIMYICREQSCSTLFLEVREQNLPAIALYKAAGFAQIALRKSYYSSPKDNAVIMRKEIDQISHH